MSDTPTEFSTVPDGEPSIPKAAARSSEGVVRHQDKQLEPSINLYVYDDYGAEITEDQWNAIAIRLENEKRRERIARRLEP